jgi:hypothetical protein
MFRHRSAILRDSTRTKSSTPIQVLIARTVIINNEILEYTVLSSINLQCCDIKILILY